VGFARKAYDKVKARKAASRNKGKGKPRPVETYDPHAERREVKAIMRAAA
jgi:hypothetical protein